MMASKRDDWDRHWDEYSQAAQQNPAQEYRRRVVFSLLGRRGCRRSHARRGQWTGRHGCGDSGSVAQG